MSKKTKLTTIGGGAQYAKVPDRILMFRNDNPRGKIETIPSFLPDGALMYKAYILKDKADEYSADATAHSLYKPKLNSDGTIKDEQKVFEKQETIAVGRALALLGYSAGGDIASSEEMEEFEDYKESQRIEAMQESIEKINSVKSLEELAELWKDIGNVKANPEVISAKDAKKESLSESKKGK